MYLSALQAGCFFPLAKIETKNSHNFWVNDTAFLEEIPEIMVSVLYPIEREAKVASAKKKNNSEKKLFTDLQGSAHFPRHRKSYEQVHP